MSAINPFSAVEVTTHTASDGQTANKSKTNNAEESPNRRKTPAVKNRSKTPLACPFPDCSSAHERCEELTVHCEAGRWVWMPWSKGVSMALARRFTQWVKHMESLIT